MRKLWFKRKLYGFGWTPCSWEGWLSVFIWAILFIFATLDIKQDSINNIIFMILSTMFLVLISYKKGEKPRWQWGNRIKDLPAEKDQTNNL